MLRDLIIERIRKRHKIDLSNLPFKIEPREKRRGVTVRVGETVILIEDDETLYNYAMLLAEASLSEESRENLLKLLYAFTYLTKGTPLTYSQFSKEMKGKSVEEIKEELEKIGKRYNLSPEKAGDTLIHLIDAEKLKIGIGLKSPGENYAKTERSLEDIIDEFTRYKG